MKRSMMQVYVRDSVGAAELYTKAFRAETRARYTNADGTYMHCELDACGQIIAISEAEGEIVAGSTMQFCMHFEPDEREAVERAYAVLKEGAEIVSPLGRCPFSECMFALVDRYGVCWCVFN